MSVLGSDVLKNKKEQFKNILRTLLKIALILSQTAVFAHVWLNEYNNYKML